MEKKVIAILLSVGLTVSCMGPIPVSAAGTTAEEAAASLVSEETDEDPVDEPSDSLEAAEEAAEEADSGITSADETDTSPDDETSADETDTTSEIHDPADEEQKETAAEEKEEQGETATEELEEQEAVTEEKIEEIAIEESAAEEKSASVSINATEIDLYAIAEAAEETVQIPSGYRKSFQLKVSGLPAGTKVYYRVEDGFFYATVTKDGLIEARPDTGTALIKVYAGDHTFDVTVHVHNYATIYAHGVMDQYYDQKVKNKKSVKDKLDAIGAFSAQYDYSMDYSSATDMIIFGGGSCWASTEACLYLCEKAGIRARTLYHGYLMHTSCVAYAGGKTYQIETYEGKAPRSYAVFEMKDLFSIEPNEDGETASIMYYAGEEETVVIPAKINGYRITGILQNVFRQNTTMRRCVIPEGVTDIGDAAFVFCENLESVSIPSTLKRIESHGFSGCQKLTQIDVSSVEELGDEAFDSCCLTAIRLPEGIEKIGRFMFADNKNLKSIDIPSGVKEIDEYAFSGCGLTKVTFRGKAVRSIGDMAFENNSIRSFRVPAGVRDLSVYALLGNPLEEYVVDASNKVYSSDSGVLFSKDGTELVRYPENRSGDSYTIPDRVKTVRSYAFYNAGNLKEIVVPASVRKLEDSSLSTVRMERGMDRYHLDYRFLGSAPEIGKEVFVSEYNYSGFWQTCDVYYPSDEASWKELASTDDERFNGVIWHAVGEEDPDDPVEKTAIDDFAVYGIEDKVYTGRSVTQKITVSDGNVALLEGTDYTVSYTNNTQIGIASITISGIGNYTGAITEYFEIILGAPRRVTCTNVASGIKVSWEKVEGATSYYVYRDGIYLFKTSALVVTDKDVKYDTGTKYVYKVIATAKSFGDSPKARTATMYRLMPVGIKSITNPSAGKMTVTYDYCAGGSGYVVRYGLSSDMSDAKVITVKGENTTSRTFGGMKKGKTYYVQVRTYKIENGVRYYSGYCTTKKITISK